MAVLLLLEMMVGLASHQGRGTQLVLPQLIADARSCMSLKKKARQRELGANERQAKERVGQLPNRALLRDTENACVLPARRKHPE
jgi:hypothetical protein